MRERYRRETKARRPRFAQKGRRQHEHRIGAADAFERRVERRNKERIPECAPGFRVLPGVRQPRLEGLQIRFAAGVATREQCARQRASYAQLAAEMQVWIPRERREQMQRCGQIGGAQVTRGTVPRQNQRVETLLHVQVTFHSDPPRESDELGAAGQKHVLPVVDFASVDFERRRAAAEQPAALEKLDARAGILQFQSGGQSRQTRADDRYPLLLSHDLTTTRNFSVFDSAARARKGSAGSRSIFLRSSS